MTTETPNHLLAYNAILPIIPLTLTVLLVWMGAVRMPANWGERVASAGIVTFALIGWFVLALYLSRANVYWAPNNPVLPTIQFGILVPIPIGLWLITGVARFRRLVDAIPLSWLVGVQVYRTFGVMFLILWWRGHLPWEFALPAGLGDITVGVLALVVAVMLALRRPEANHAAYAWCWFGIADLAVAVTTGALTSPGRLHLLSLDAPNMLITAYPLVMIPTFAVPLSIILHGLCLWRIRHRLVRRAA